MNTRAPGINRAEAVRRVMTAIALNPSPIELEFTAADGTQPLVVTTPSEYVSDVIKRIEALGGSANIALAEARGWKLFVIERLGTSGDGEEADDLVNRELSMGMLFLKMQRGTLSSFSVRHAAKKIPSGARTFEYAS